MPETRQCTLCSEFKEEKDYQLSKWKSGRAVCAECDRARTESYAENFRREHLKKELVLCEACNTDLPPKSFTNAALGKSRPRCRSCDNKRRKGNHSIIRAAHKKRGCAKCRSCGETKGLRSFQKEQLGRKNPFCRKCRYIYIQSLGDPLWVEKRKIWARIFSSLRSKSDDFKIGSLARDYLGCSKPTFIKHMESQFRDGMTWENRGKWHMDHIIPLSTAKTSEDIKKLWHYENLQPLWAEENLAKGDKLDWSLEEYLREKEEKV